MPLAVMIRSLLASHNPDHPVTFYIFESDLSSLDRERLEATAVGKDVSVVWVRTDHSRLHGLPNAIHLSIYDRLLVGDMLPLSVSKVIWLDADVLVMRDIRELWAQDLDGKAVLAAQDMAIPYVSCPLGLGEWRALGSTADTPHFNSGVLLIDLNVWRKEAIGPKSIRYLRSRRRSIALYDQEALNAVLLGRWGVIDPRWNVIVSIGGRWFQGRSHLPPEVHRRTIEDPWILHFAGDRKPWSLPLGQYPYGLYFRYLDQTPWAGWRPRASIGGRLRAFYYEHLRENLYPLEALYTAFRFHRLPGYLRYLRSHKSRLAG